MLQLGDGKKLSPSKRDSLPRNLYFSFLYPMGQMGLNSPQNWPRVWWAYHLMADSPALRTIGSRSFLGNVQIYISGLCQDASQCKYQFVGVVPFTTVSSLDPGQFWWWRLFTFWERNVPGPLPQRCGNAFQVFFHGFAQVQLATATRLQRRPAVQEVDLQVFHLIFSWTKKMYISCKIRVGLKCPNLVGR